MSDRPARATVPIGAETEAVTGAREATVEIAATAATAAIAADRDAVPGR